MAEIFASITHIRKNFLIKKIISELENKIDDTIILFGSFVKGGHTKKSDIDLFVISDKKIKRSIVFETANFIDRDINIQSTTGEKFLAGLKNRDPLVNEVVSNHIVLKGADKFCDIMWRYHAIK